MNRRDWLKNAALLVAAGVAADQLELLDRLQPRSLFAAWSAMPTIYGDGVHGDADGLEAWLHCRSVWDAGTGRVLHGGEASSLHNGRFILDRPVVVTMRDDRAPRLIANSHFRCEPYIPGAPFTFRREGDPPPLQNFTLSA